MISVVYCDVTCKSLGGLSEVFPPAYFLSTYTSFINSRTLSTLLQAENTIKQLPFISTASIVVGPQKRCCTCYQAISAFVGSNPSNIFPLHAENILMSGQHNNKKIQLFPKPTKIHHHLYLIATILKSFNFLGCELRHGY